MPTSARPVFSRTPRQGTRALPYKKMLTPHRADRVVRPYRTTCNPSIGAAGRVDVGIDPYGV